MKKLLLVWAFVILILSSFVSAEVTELIFTNRTYFQDTFVYEESSTTNFGNSVIFQIGNTASAPTSRSRGLINLNRSCEEVEGASVQNVTIQMYVSEGRNPDTNFSMYPFNATWDEMSVTYSNCGDAAGCLSNYNSSWAVVNYTGGVNTTDDESFINFTLNLTYYEMFCNGSMGNYSQGLLFDTAPVFGINNFDNFDSTNATNTTRRPKLIINLISNPLNLTNCTGTSTLPRLLNLSVFDEDGFNPLTSNIGGVINYYYDNDNFIKNYTVNLEGDNSYLICSDDLEYDHISIVSADFYYNVSGGFTQRWFLRSANISNSTIGNVDMYNYDDTTGISDLKGVLKEDQSYQNFPNVITKLLRYYPSVNEWKTVQMDLSDDQGQIFFNIVEQNTDYKLIFEYNLNVLRTTDPLKFICDSGICSVTFLLTPYSGGVGLPDLAYVYAYDNSTGVVTVDFNDPTGLTTEVRLNVERVTTRGSTTICDNTVSASSGSVTCDLSSYNGNFMVRLYGSASPEVPFFTKLVDRVSRDLKKLIPDKEGNILGFGLALTVVGIGLFSPIAAMISSITALIIVAYLGLISYINITFIILAGIGAILIGLKVRR